MLYSFVKLILSTSWVIQTLAANKIGIMLPKNPQTFNNRLKLLLAEVDEILNDQQLRKNFKELSIRKNIFRSKCLDFLAISFVDPDNSYRKEFADNFPEVSQLHISIFSNGSTPAPIGHSIQNLEFAKHLFTKYIEVNDFTVDLVSDLPTEATDEGLFFKGQYYDAIFHLNKIISNATTEIKLVDNYINFDLIAFLTNHQQNISIKILSTNNNITSLRLPLSNFQRQHSTIVIKESTSNHDRFLVLDDLHVFHFGASLKDLGSKTFMFSKINQPSIVSAFISEFDIQWSRGNQLFP